MLASSRRLPTLLRNQVVVYETLRAQLTAIPGGGALSSDVLSGSCPCF